MSVADSVNHIKPGHFKDFLHGVESSCINPLCRSVSLLCIFVCACTCMCVHACVPGGFLIDLADQGTSTILV